MRRTTKEDAVRAALVAFGGAAKAVEVARRVGIAPKEAAEYLRRIATREGRSVRIWRIRGEPDG